MGRERGKTGRAIWRFLVYDRLHLIPLSAGSKMGVFPRTPPLIRPSSGSWISKSPDLNWTNGKTSQSARRDGELVRYRISVRKEGGRKNYIYIAQVNSSHHLPSQQDQSYQVTRIFNSLLGDRYPINPSHS